MHSSVQKTLGILHYKNSERRKGLTSAGGQSSQSFWEPFKCGQYVEKWQIQKEALQHAPVFQKVSRNKWL